MHGEESGRFNPRREKTTGNLPGEFPRHDYQRIEDNAHFSGELNEKWHGFKSSSVDYYAGSLYRLLFCTDVRCLPVTHEFDISSHT